ncbi:MAG: ChbG/HpnK family deacetylase [Candidatus Woesearchaeota archaeon]|jgi:predicted glycoside hydrolase/deacetylase ChbG (UPF0249 family)|nr:ChbG/HpnK family deacetylase [Candidatus Woesearchaeota archaeon]
MKRIIINADDFGYSVIFNESILNLIENNLVTSTTVMVNWVSDEQEEQIKKIIELKEKYNLSIGLHLEFKNENFEKEIAIQYNHFSDIFSFNPSHIDIHKPKKSDEEILVISNFCKENNLPCRTMTNKLKDVKTTNKLFNGTDSSFEDLDEMIKSMQEDEIYEILFHPGTYDENCKSSLNEKRELDIEKIKYLVPKLDKNNIQLVSYNDL